MQTGVHLHRHQLSHLDTQVSSERRLPLHSPLGLILPKAPFLDHALRTDVHHLTDGPPPILTNRPSNWPERDLHLSQPWKPVFGRSGILL